MASLNSLLQKANQNSVYHKELMNESYVNIKFSTNEAEYTAYNAGDTLTYGDETFVLLEDYIPSYNSNTCGYDYDMKFMAWYYAWENKLFKLNGYAAEFTLTDKPSTFISLLASNTGATISTEGLGDNNTIDDLVPFITLTFDGTNCLEALDMIVKALDPDCNYYEWWSDGSSIKIGKLIGSGSGTTLTVGSNVANVQVQKSGGKSIGKLYAYGSSRNLSRRYGATMIDINATEEYEDYGITAYFDSEHTLKQDMFPTGGTNIRYHNVSFEGNCYLNDTETYKTVLKIPFTVATTDALITNELCKAMINEPITLNVVSTLTDGEGHYEIPKVSVRTYFGTEEAGGSGGTVFEYYVTASQPSIKDGKATYKYIIELDLDYFDINTYENRTPILFVDIDIKYDAAQSQNPQYTPTIYIQDTDLTMDLEGKNYQVLVDEASDTWMNPMYVYYSDKRARYLNKSFVGVPDKIIKHKCPAYWFPMSETVDYNGAQLNKRLSLDAPIDGNGTAEAIVTFDDIYPTTENTLGECSIKSVDEEDSNGEKTGVTLNYYTFVDANLKNISTDIFTEDTAKISFLTGSLAGMEFELKLVKSNENGTTLCIIPNDSYGCMLPNSSMYPASGNKYAIIGIDISVYEQDGKTDLVADAKERLETLAQAYLDANNADQNVYTCTMICTATSAPSFGSTVTFNSNTTRVIGVQHPLDVPMADYQVTIGNSLSYKRLAALERKTAGIK